MSIRNRNDIRVYNEQPFQINLVGQNKEYVFPSCENGQPTMNYVSWQDIEYANSRGTIFANGSLIFNESEQEEIYNELGIRNWKDTVWFDKDIIDVIENPTLEKMQRVIDITNALVFERIRGKVVSYINHKKNVSQNVINIVNTRYRELTSGIVKSKIVIRSTDVEKPVSADEVVALKQQLAEMQKMMEALVADRGKTEVAPIDVKPEVVEATPAPAKRSSKKSVTTKK